MSVPTEKSTRLRAAAEPARVLDPPTERVVGIPVAVTDYGATLDWIDETVNRDGRGYICVSNVHSLMAAREDPGLRDALLGSSLNVPDGMPLVWALNLLGKSLRDRVYGPELMARSCERAATTGQRVYLYGGRNEGALVQLTLNLRRRYPGLRIVGGHCPPFRPLDPEEEDHIAQEINASGADVVWVGIGVPKQEKWMAAMRDRLQAPVLVGVGAAFDFHAGLVPQAPAVLQNAGLEWAYRLLQEPRRLFRRYVRYNPWFVLAFAHQLLTRGASGRPAGVGRRHRRR